MVDDRTAGYRMAYHRTVYLVIILMIAIGCSLIIFPVLAETIEWQSVRHDTPMGELIRDFGFALLIAGSAGVGYEFMLRNAFAAEVELTLSRIIDERNAELNKLKRAGVRTIHKRLAHARLADYFEEADRSIRILQTWSGDFNNIADTLVRAVNRGCQIRILLLNPESVQAQQRGKDLGYVDSSVVKTLIRNDLEILRKCYLRCGEVKNRIQVRLYDSTPVIPIYGYDNTNVVGIYWRQKHSQEGPQLEVRNPEVDYHHGSNMYLAETVAEHFEDIWNDEKTKPVPWWEEPENSSQNEGSSQVPHAEEMVRHDTVHRNGPETVRPDD